MSFTSDEILYAELLSFHAQRRGDNIALVYQGEEFTYSYLDIETNKVANGLVDEGLQASDRVAILDVNSAKYVQVMFGISKAACTIVGVNARLAAPEVAYILKDSDSKLLFVGEEHYALVALIENELADCCQIIALDDNHSRWQNFSDWCDSMPNTPVSRHPSLNDDVVQLYTSGTTGHPKGVCHTNRNLKNASFEAMNSDSEFGWAIYDSQSCVLLSLPLFHVGGFNPLRLAFKGGAKVVLTRGVDVEEILSLIPQYHITDSFFVPAVIQSIVSHAKAKTADFSSLRCISYGAAPISETTLSEARKTFGTQCTFYHLYGMTENLGFATCLPNSKHCESLGKLRSCGLPYPGVELKIVGDSGEELQPNEVGEILTRCSWTMREYWHNPEATRETIKDGWVYTGDAGYLDEEGFLYIHDRMKDMIISGGENIYPTEVENALFSYPDIVDAAVIGVPDDKWGEAVKAIVVVKSGHHLDEVAIEHYLRGKIAGYKIPRSWDVIAELPRNASGKVLRRKLREKYWSSRTRQVN